MDILDAIFTRRSIRKFTGELVSENDLATILKAGFQAPSAHNNRPWHFIVSKDKSKFEKIMMFHPYSKMLSQAGFCIIVCGDENKQSLTGFLIEDCSAAIENMLLAAHGIGLGAVWCGLYPKTPLIEGMKELFILPDSIIPVGMIVIGHKGEDRIAEDRYDSTKIHYEQW